MQYGGLHVSFQSIIMPSVLSSSRCYANPTRLHANLNLLSIYIAGVLLHYVTICNMATCMLYTHLHEYSMTYAIAACMYYILAAIYPFPIISPFPE